MGAIFLQRKLFGLIKGAKPFGKIPVPEQFRPVDRWGGIAIKTSGIKEFFGQLSGIKQNSGRKARKPVGEQAKQRQNARRHRRMRNLTCLD